MSLDASEVRAPGDMFRCRPYRETIAGEACLSKQRAALDGTKSLAKCIGCEDGACIRESLERAPAPVTPYSSELADPDELAGTAEPASPPEKEVAMSKVCTHAGCTNHYHAPKNRKVPAGTETFCKDCRAEFVKTHGGAKTTKKQWPKLRAPAAATPYERSLTEVAALLGIDVDALLRREIAAVLGLS